MMVWSSNMLSHITNDFSTPWDYSRNTYLGSLADGTRVTVKRLEMLHLFIDVSYNHEIRRLFSEDVERFSAMKNDDTLLQLPLCVSSSMDDDLCIVTRFQNSLDACLGDRNAVVLNTGAQRVRAAEGIARDLAELHGRGLLFGRFLAADKVLVRGDGSAFLTGFCLSAFGYFKAIKNDTPHSIPPEAPETACHGKYTSASDVFSLGVIMLRMIAPFEDDPRVLIPRVRPGTVYGMYDVRPEDVPPQEWPNIVAASFAIASRARRGKVLPCSWEDATLVEFGTLAMRCIVRDATDRPTAQHVVDELVRMLEA